MKISELIEWLEETRDEHGDLGVVIANSRGFYDYEIGLRVGECGAPEGTVVIW